MIFILYYRCDELINFCASQPCPANYYCANSASGYACYPATVTIAISPCSSNPCLNDGACEIGLDNSYSCKCKFGYVGKE